MTELRTKEDVTLEKLRFAVARVEAYRAMPIIEAIKRGIGWAAAERDAWRAAFFWFHHHMERPDEGKEKDAEYFAEYKEGMRLIRETLK